MFKKATLALLASASCLAAGIDPAAAIDAALPPPTVFYANQGGQPVAPVRTAYNDRSSMGGGFIEFLFGDGQAQGGRYPQQPAYEQQPPVYQQQPSYEPRRPLLPGEAQQPEPQQEASDPNQRPFDPKFEKQVVDYSGKESAGTVVVDTPNKFLYLVQGNGKALRYGIGVGKPGFTWSGVKTISAKKEWPDWTPPPENAGAPSRFAAGTWKADRKTRSARARCISARRSTASMAPTSPGRSAPTCRPAASGCAIRT